MALEGAPESGGRCRVHLKSGGALLESRTLETSGAVEFAELETEDYEVEIDAAGEKITFLFSFAPGE